MTKADRYVVRLGSAEQGGLWDPTGFHRAGPVTRHLAGRLSQAPAERGPKLAHKLTQVSCDAVVLLCVVCVASDPGSA